MDLTSIALSDKERTEGLGPCNISGAEKDKGPRYSYGTRIQLGQAELKKLGWKVSDFEVGQELTIEATAEVIELSQNDGKNGSNSRVELQITALGLDEDDTPEAAVSRGVRKASS